MASAAALIQQGGVAFGTSGARGLVADFTPEVCAAFTLAFIQSQLPVRRLAIGIDNRPSSPAIAQACIAAAASQGVEVDYYGVLPTPAVAHTSMADGVPAIVVTGSHIPFDRNGLKFYRADGEISKADEQAILNASITVPEITLADLPPVSNRAVENYLKRYLDIFPADTLSGKRIGIYEHSSAGRDLYGQLFESLGANVISLGRSDSFVPIDTEAVSAEDTAMAQAWQQEHALDAVYSTDGDGDRPLLSDETGVYLRGDVLCLLAAKSLGIEALAVPVSCNTAIESSAAFKFVTRTKIGSPYVIEAMNQIQDEYSAIAGFEANGGFLLGSSIEISGATITALATRDAVLPALAVLSAAKETPVSSLVKALPQRFTASDRLQNIARETSLALLSDVEENPAPFFAKLDLADGDELVKIDKTDGVRFVLSSGTVVHLRPSGNAPELRCYVEASSSEEATRIMQAVFANIRA